MSEETKYDSPYDDPLWDKYVELAADPASSADNIWKAAKELNEKYATNIDMEYNRSKAAIEVVMRDPKYNPEEMLNEISAGNKKGYNMDTKAEESEQYSVAATALAMIAKHNPDLAEKAMAKIYNDIFKKFPDDEKLQRDCLNTMQELNQSRQNFDEDAQKYLDLTITRMQKHIKAETIKRASGRQTTWNNSTSDQTNPNPLPHDEKTNDDKNESVVGKEDNQAQYESTADRVKNYSGRNWQEEREKRLDKMIEEYKERSKTSEREYNINEYNINNDMDYGR